MAQATATDSSDVEARVHEALSLVPILVAQLRRQLGHSRDPDDLISAGREGLFQAARGFDPARGVPFRAFATMRIRGAILDAFRSGGAVPRRVYKAVRALQAADHVQDARLENSASNPPKSPEEADAALSEGLATSAMAMAVAMMSMRGGEAIDGAKDDTPTPEEQLGRAKLGQRIRTLIEEQPEAEKTILLRHYFDDVTLEEAGKTIGLSKSWTSRVHARALETLTRAMRRDGLDSNS